MLLQSLILSAVIASLFGAYLGYRRFKRHRNIFKEMGVPEIPSGFFFGNWASYMEAENPFDLEIEMIHKYGKVFGFYEGFTPYLMCADYDMVKDIAIKQYNSFLDRQDPTYPRQGLTFVTDITGDHWKHSRQLLSYINTPANVRRIEPFFIEFANKIASDMGRICDSDQDVEGYSYFYTFQTSVNSKMIMGIDIDTFASPNHPFVQATKEDIRGSKCGSFVNALIRLFPHHFEKVVQMLPSTRSIYKAIDFISNAANNEIEMLKADESVSRPDYLSTVLHNEKDPNDPANADARVVNERGEVWLRNGLTRGEIVGYGISILVSTIRTITSGLLMTLFALSQNPEIQEKLYAELKTTFPKFEDITLEKANQVKYLNMVICEALRCYTPSLSINRVCTSDAVVKSLRIPKGLIVRIPMHGIHHNPDYWYEPSKYDPERFNVEHQSEIDQMPFLPFGIGQRICLGKQLALGELKVVVARLILQFKFKLSPTTKLPIRLESCTDYVPLEGIHFRPEKRD